MLAVMVRVDSSTAVAVRVALVTQQDALSKSEKEKRPLHRQVAMSVSSASTHSMESTQTKSLEAQDDIILRRSSHYPQGLYIDFVN